MKYLLLIYGNEAAMQSATKSDVEQMHAAYGAYTEALQKAGVIVGGERLRPSASGTTVRVAAGKTKVPDGPYAETREQLGGFYMIDVPDLDAALSWAARCPGASHGVVEVRPIWAMSPGRRRCRGKATARLAGLRKRRPGRATASWSPFSRIGCATSPPPKMRWPTRSRRHSSTGRGAGCPPIPRRGPLRR